MYKLRDIKKRNTLDNFRKSKRNESKDQMVYLKQ